MICRYSGNVSFRGKQRNACSHTAALLAATQQKQTPVDQPLPVPQPLPQVTPISALALPASTPISTQPLPPMQLATSPSTTSKQQKQTKKRKSFGKEGILEVMGVDIGERTSNIEQLLKKQLKREEKQVEQVQQLQQLQLMQEHETVDNLTVAEIKNQIKLRQNNGITVTSTGKRVVFSEGGKQKNKAELVTLLKELIAGEKAGLPQA